MKQVIKAVIASLGFVTSLGISRGSQKDYKIIKSKFNLHSIFNGTLKTEVTKSTNT